MNDMNVRFALTAALSAATLLASISFFNSSLAARDSSDRTSLLGCHDVKKPVKFKHANRSINSNPANYEFEITLKNKIDKKADDVLITLTKKASGFSTGPILDATVEVSRLDLAGNPSATSTTISNATNIKRNDINKTVTVGEATQTVRVGQSLEFDLNGVTGFDTPINNSAGTEVYGANTIGPGIKIAFGIQDAGTISEQFDFYAELSRTAKAKKHGVLEPGFLKGPLANAHRAESGAVNHHPNYLMSLTNAHSELSLNSFTGKASLSAGIELLAVDLIDETTDQTVPECTCVVSGNSFTISDFAQLPGHVYTIRFEMNDEPVNFGVEVTGVYAEQ
jgi:hypothetical protein